MMSHLFFWSLFGSLVGAILGIMFSKGDPVAPLALGVPGGFLGILGGIMAARVQAKMGRAARHMDYPAIGGCLVGMISGGVIGAYSGFAYSGFAYSGFGRVMIALFNPDLSCRDFVSSSGFSEVSFCERSLAGVLSACW